MCIRDRCWKSPAENSDEAALSGRSVAELKVALLLSSADHSDDAAERERSADDNDHFALRPESELSTSPCCREQPDVSVTAKCDDENEIDERNWSETAEERVIPDVVVNSCSPIRSYSEVDGDGHQSFDAGVDVTDSTAGDDVGYFSLPVRRSDRHRHHQTAERTSWHNFTTASDDRFKQHPPTTYGCDCVSGSLSPAAKPRTDADSCEQPDNVISSSFLVVSEDGR